MFAFGERVYNGTGKFEKGRGVDEFDKPLVFDTTVKSEGQEYSVLSLTLQLVSGVMRKPVRFRSGSSTATSGRYCVTRLCPPGITILADSRLLPMKRK